MRHVAVRVSLLARCRIHSDDRCGLRRMRVRPARAVAPRPLPRVRRIDRGVTGGGRRRTGRCRRRYRSAPEPVVASRDQTGSGSSAGGRSSPHRVVDRIGRRDPSGQGCTPLGPWFRRGRLGVAVVRRAQADHRRAGYGAIPLAGRQCLGPPLLGDVVPARTAYLGPPAAFRPAPAGCRCPDSGALVRSAGVSNIPPPRTVPVPPPRSPNRGAQAGLLAFLLAASIFAYFGFPGFSGGPSSLELMMALPNFQVGPPIYLAYVVLAFREMNRWSHMYIAHAALVGAVFYLLVRLLVRLLRSPAAMLPVDEPLDPLRRCSDGAAIAAGSGRSSAASSSP